MIASSAHGALEWESTVVQPDVSQDDNSVEAIFPFKNSGGGTIEITSIRSDCSCTVAKLEKMVYQPGESGEIKATFEFGARQGPQKKTIKVTTNESEEPTILVIRATIPETIDIAPRFVFWKRGEVAEPQIIRINVKQDDPINITSASSSDSKIQAILKTIEPGRTYEVTVFPQTVDRPFRSLITLKTDASLGTARSYTVHAVVK